RGRDRTPPGRTAHGAGRRRATRPPARREACRGRRRSYGMPVCPAIIWSARHPVNVRIARRDRLRCAPLSPIIPPAGRSRRQPRGSHRRGGAIMLNAMKRGRFGGIITEATLVAERNAVYRSRANAFEFDEIDNDEPIESPVPQWNEVSDPNKLNKALLWELVG